MSIFISPISSFTEQNINDDVYPHNNAFHNEKDKRRVVEKGKFFSKKDNEERKKEEETIEYNKYTRNLCIIQQYSFKNDQQTHTSTIHN